jgi:hypothetical protein
LVRSKRGNFIAWPFLGPGKKEKKLGLSRTKDFVKAETSRPKIEEFHQRDHREHEVERRKEAFPLEFSLRSL